MLNVELLQYLCNIKLCYVVLERDEGVTVYCCSRYFTRDNRDPAMRSYEIRSTFHTTRNLYKINIAHMLQQYN